MTDNTAPRLPMLERLPTSSHTFEKPSKRISDGNDLAFFLSTTAYRDLTLWLMQLNRAMFPIRTADGRIIPTVLDVNRQYDEPIVELRAMLDDFAMLIERAPPSTGPRRFGNVAFRDWYRLAEAESNSLLQKHLGSLLSRYHTESGTVLADGLWAELGSYLLHSFGSPQRLDYGTGHELSFLAFLACLWKLSVFEGIGEADIVTGLVQPYLDLVRKLILTYTLEPAGSHGVWGLDDHSFLPYIFGSAQFGPPINERDLTQPVPTEGSLDAAPSPSTVTSRPTVAEYKSSNMYFSAIQFIYDVKKGPFWEHSPILYDISSLKDGWGKINKGMLKMYAAEVLGKFPVVQHFLFGSLLRWEQDPEAAIQWGSVHAQQLPPSGATKNTIGESRSTSTGAMSATTAPWAASGSTSRGVPITSMNAPTMAPTAAPWSSMPRSAPPSSRNTQAMTNSKALPRRGPEG